MRVLVTGHNGYIGSVLVPILQAAGHEVVGLDTFFFSACSFDDGQPPSPSTIPASLKDIRDVSEADLCGFDAVVHLAALCNDPLGNLNPAWTDAINHVAAVRLARIAKDAGVARFLFSSSCSIYGGFSRDAELSEDDPICPMTPYARSKVQAEEGIRKLAGENFCPVFLRNATAYGVSPRLRADQVLNHLVGWACATGEIRILSDGSPWRPIVHVQDISRVFSTMLWAPWELVYNQAFNVGRSTENYRVRDLAEIVQNTVPKSTISYAEPSVSADWSYRVDFGRLARIFPAFKFVWDAKSGAEELCRSFWRAGLRREDLEGRKYMRLRQIKHLIKTGALDADLRWCGRKKNAGD